MTDARTTRLGEIIHHRVDDSGVSSRTIRLGAIAHHRIDAATISSRTTRIGAIVFVRQSAPGWDAIERVLMPTLV